MIWVDVSYTRTQRGGDIGITRTVRRLFGELRALGHACEPVAFHSTGFRRVQWHDTDVGRENAQAAPARDGALYRLITGGLARQIIPLVLRVLPWSWLRPVWERSSAIAFDALTQTGQAVVFGEGDVLLMADASWNYAAWHATRRARAHGARVVLLVYDLMPLRHPEFCFPLVPRLYRMWLEQMLRCTDAVVCISAATEDDVRVWASEPRQMIELPPIGHFRLGSDAAAPGSRGHVRPVIDDFLSQAGSCFAAVGSFEPKKNYSLLLQAFELLWARGEVPRLVIAGRPTTDSAQLIETLHQHAQRGLLLLTVHDASDSEIVALYERCRALLLPSLFEGFGLSLVEARTRGCPVIASDLPVFAELADDGVAQFDRRSAQALAEQVEADMRQDRRGRTPAMMGFTWTDSARELANLMDRLLASDRR